MLFIRFLLPLAACLGILALSLVPFSDSLITGWLVKDTQARSRLVASSIEDYLSDSLGQGQDSRINNTLTRLSADERLIGIAFCEQPGAPRFKSASFPDSLSCGPPLRQGEYFEQMQIKGGPVMVARFPYAASAEKPRYTVVVHDMSFAARRSETARRYALLFVLCVSLLSVAVTLGVARLTIHGWISGIRKYLRTGAAPAASPETAALLKEMRQEILRMEREYIRSGIISMMWSADTLHDFVVKKLPSEQLISVSYRQPYSHQRSGGKITWSVPASGLVTALEPIMKACKGTWIAVSTGEADREAVDGRDCVSVPPDSPSYTLKRLWLNKEEEDGFYAGFANEGIWPLCCSVAYVKPRFRPQDWEHYQAVNRRFADAVVAEATSDRPIVFIQDYHFALLPQYIREKLPNAVIVCFWHIPWPNSEVFGILPWRQEFLSGMLAADIVGFHTRYMCNNFLDCVDAYAETLIDREHNTVMRGNSVCAVRPYPISIAWPEEPLEPSVAGCRENLLRTLEIAPGTKILLGVERLDYVKGIPERLRAFELLLERHPSLRGKVVLVQIASPSRSVISAYADLGRDIEAQVEAINASFRMKGWQPVHLLKKNFSQKDVYNFYRAADVCIVSSLHDGMNLVAKEFVAARDDNRGVLVLSQFTGAARELTDALIVNPYDEEGVLSTFKRAMEMTESEQEARMRVMREQVQTRNVYAWAGKILGDAAKLYSRRQLEDKIRKLNTASENLTYRKMRKNADD